MREFVNVAQGRDGSFMLRTSLGSHPEVRCMGEVFQPHRMYAKLRHGKPNAAAVIREIYALESGISAAGFNFRWNHARRPPWLDARKELIERRVSVIHLRRENLLRRHLSSVLANKTRVWNVKQGDDYPTPGPVILDAAELANTLAQLDRRYADNRWEFRTLRSIGISYESLCLHYSETIRDLFRFLGVDPTWKPTTAAVKMQTRPLQEAISNIEEVAAALQGTEWERFLDDE